MCAHVLMGDSARSKLILFIIATLLFTAAAYFSSRPAEASWPATQITDKSFDCVWPSLHNGQIAFERSRGAGIWFWDGTYNTGVPSQSVQIDSSGAKPSLHAGTIVYEKSDHTYYWLGSGNPQPLPYGGFSEWPNLHDGKIAFVTLGSSYDVKLWDGTSVIDVASTSYSERSPSLFGDQIAYTGAVSVNVDIEIYLWDNGTTHQITNSPGLHDRNPSLYGGQLAWDHLDSNDYEILFRADPLNPGTQQQVTNNQYDDIEPSLWNGKVAWYGWDGNDWEVFYWDGGSVRQVTNNSVDDMYPSLHRGKIAYSSDVQGTFQVMLTQIPEPSIVAILATGILGLLGRMRNGSSISK